MTNFGQTKTQLEADKTLHNSDNAPQVKAAVQKPQSRVGKYEIYEDTNGEWRFRLKAANGEVVAVSEGYSSKAAALNGVDSVRKNAQSTVVDEV